MAQTLGLQADFPIFSCSILPALTSADNEDKSETLPSFFESQTCVSLSLVYILWFNVLQKTR